MTAGRLSAIKERLNDIPKVEINAATLSISTKNMTLTALAHTIGDKEQAIKELSAIARMKEDCLSLITALEHLVEETSMMVNVGSRLGGDAERLYKVFKTQMEEIEADSRELKVRQSKIYEMILGRGDGKEG